MENPQPARAQILDAAVRVQQPRVARERKRHRVHSEVAAGQILLDRRRPHLGQGAGPGIGLGPRLSDVDLVIPGLEPAGHEVLVALGPVAGKVGQGLRVALDRDVQVRPLCSQQEVPDRPADQVGRHPLGETADGVDPRQRVDRLRQSCGVYVP